MKRKPFRIFIVTLLIALAISQFFSPEYNEGPIIEENDLFSVEVGSPNLTEVFKDACYDCHSNSTTYPIYAKISPVSFWIQGHIDHGKEHLNFSEWTTYSPEKRKHKLEECIEEIERNNMPLKSYTWLHADAKMTADQKNLVIEWCRSIMSKY
jgi:hypothetical protein